MDLEGAESERICTPSGCPPAGMQGESHQSRGCQPTALPQLQGSLSVSVGTVARWQAWPCACAHSVDFPAPELARTLGGQLAALASSVVVGAEASSHSCGLDAPALLSPPALNTQSPETGLNTDCPSLQWHLYVIRGLFTAQEEWQRAGALTLTGFLTPGNSEAAGPAEG